MSEQFPYDDELDGGGLVPQTEEFTRLMRANLVHWIDYLRVDPPLQDLELKASRIMEDIQMASGLPGAEREAVELALAVDVKFERLGLWRSWYPRLMALYGPANERITERSRVKFFRCLMNYYIHRGDMVRANKIINYVLDLASIDAELTLLQVYLAQERVAITLGQLADGAELLEQMFSLAQIIGNGTLLGRVYGVLAHYYSSRWDGKNTFQYGQMMYSVGIAYHDDKLILDGMHFVAVAFYLLREYTQTFRYIELAMQYSYWSGDSNQIDYMWYTCGTCYYGMGDFSQAEYFMRGSVRAFEGSGHYHALALLSHGLCLIKLKSYAEAERALTGALNEWGKLNQPVDQIYAKHALAELCMITRRYDEAVARLEATLADAEALGERCHSFLLDELRKDRKKYRALRDADADNGQN
jgi:tetratricopeptide (TPR) repeat protein